MERVRCGYRLEQIDQIGNVGGGLKREAVLPRANAEFPAVSISPNQSFWERSGWKKELGGRERKDDSSPGVGGGGSLLYKILELLPQSGHLFLPEETWQSLHYLQFSYYVSVDYKVSSHFSICENYILLNSSCLLNSSGAFSTTVQWLWPLARLWPWLIRIFLMSSP